VKTVVVNELRVFHNILHMCSYVYEAAWCNG